MLVLRSKIIISLGYISQMSSMNLFQEFVAMETERAKMQLPNPISAILDYSEYSIHMDFNLSEKSNYLSKKSRKTEIAKEFVAALVTLGREQKIQYYCKIVGYLKSFSNGNLEPPKSQFTGMLNATGYSRSFNIKRWKEKKLRLDMDKHLMFAERQQKIKSYDLRNYILRRSKNKEYHCFVLEAINRIPPEKSMTVHIGFTELPKFQTWISAIKFSVDYRQWEFYLQMFQGSGLTKSMSSRMYSSDDIFVKSSSAVKTERENSNLVESQHMMTSSFVVTGSQTFSYNDQPRELKIKKTAEGQLVRQNSGKIEMEVDISHVEKEQLDSKIKEKNKLENEIKDYESKKQIGKTYVDQLIEGDVFQEPDVFEDKLEEEDEIVKQSKKHLDLFHKLYPEYELEELQLFANFQLLHQSSAFKVYQNTLLEKRLKMTVSFDKGRYNREQILSMLSKPQSSHIYNDNIESSQLKTFIPSENSALMYQVNKAYNRLYRGRDFVFIRHVFNNKSNVYMVDKSIENANYPPFLTIVRGQLCNVYGIFERKESIELIADFQIQNGGMVNPIQETNLTLKFIKGYTKLLQAQITISQYKFFQLDWDISKNKVNQIDNEIRSRRRTINMLDQQIVHSKEDHENVPSAEGRNFSKKQPQAQGTIISQQPATTPHKPIQAVVQVESSSSNGSPSKNEQIMERYAQKSPSPSPEHHKSVSPAHKKHQIKRFNENTMEQVGELNGQERQKVLFDMDVIRQLDAEGMIVVKKSFLKTRYVLGPLNQSKHVFQNSPLGHPVWKNEWIHDDKEGGMIFIHKKKIEDQKGVLKFILSKIAKNLVSGQSITSISLPVDIFSAESNLQRFLYSMSYGPLLLEGLLQQNMLTRLLRTIIFGLSNSILYLSMEKPFNPILGETFQCWINGCPAYAEQISHHPPIGALIFKGRGFEVTAQLESKVSLGMNSGTGTNDGIYRVKFADNMEICFISPGGEVSGLTAGDRRFNLVGKSYYWITNTNIMLELVFDPFKKGFFSIGKQEKPSDYFQGTIWEVRPEFMTKFLGGKRKEPEEKDRLKEYGKITGIWNRYICYNGNEIFSFDRQYPLVLEYEANPLPSDANWREDIQYRRRNQITRAQTEKERLQVLQRKDRKLREKLGKKKK